MISPDALAVVADPISAIAYSPGGRILACGSYETVRLWSLRDVSSTSGNRSGQRRCPLFIFADAMSLPTDLSLKIDNVPATMSRTKMKPRRRGSRGPTKD
jgi:hypothetical protein